MDWLSANSGTIWLVIASVVTVASAIASLTPSVKDDAVLGKISKLVDVLALNWGFAKRK